MEMILSYTEDDIKFYKVLIRITDYSLEYIKEDGIEGYLDEVIDFDIINLPSFINVEAAKEYILYWHIDDIFEYYHSLQYEKKSGMDFYHYN
jgi:hypothetical protein